MRKIIIPIIFILWLGVHITNRLICKPETLIKKKEILKRIKKDLKETEWRLINWRKKAKKAPEFIKPVFDAQVQALALTKKALEKVKKNLMDDIQTMETQRIS